MEINETDLLYMAWSRIPRWLLISVRAQARIICWVMPKSRHDPGVQQRLNILSQVIADKKARR